MSIDEAIQRENKIAEENQKIVDTQIVFDDVSISELYCDDTEVIEEHLSNYRKCAEYHKQIADWLEELSRRRVEELFRKTNDKSIRDKAIDDFQEWLKTQIVGLDNTTNEILIVVDDRWELATDKFKERVSND